MDKQRRNDFLVLSVRDANGITNFTIDLKKNKKLEKILEDIRPELSFEMHYSPEASGNITIRRIRIIGNSESLPNLTYANTDHELDYRHLSIRSGKLIDIFRIKATFIEAIREWFKKRKWIEVTPPTITGVTEACEDLSTLFEINYFGKKAFLSQTAQFYLESAIFAFERVYSIVPSYRAERKEDATHLTEYTHIEGEAAFHLLDDIMSRVEDLIEYCTRRILTKRADELERLMVDLESLEKIKKPFPRVTYDEAIEILKRKGIRCEWGNDLGRNEEAQVLSEFDGPVFITFHPKMLKAFYMKENPLNKDTVLSADLIAPCGHGEIVGCSEREDDIGKLRNRIMTPTQIKRIKDLGGDPDDYRWYFDLRRYGSVPHSGFGLGAERYIKWICNLDHIAFTTLFPRTPSRIYP